MKYEEEFAEIIGREMHSCVPTASDLTDHQRILFDKSDFAAANGNKGVANGLLGMALIKLVEPETDIPWIGDASRNGSFLRNVSKAASLAGRRYFDSSLLSGDPMAGARISLQQVGPYDEDYTGRFKDEMVRNVFLDMVRLFQCGRVLDVLRLLLNGYRDLHADRPVPVLTTATTEAEGMNYIDNFLTSNAATRMQLILWSAAYENDPTVWKLGATNANDRHHRVADVRGDNYAIECKLLFVTLTEVQNTAHKARMAGCPTVIFVSGQKTVCRDGKLAGIQQTIAEQYPDIAITFCTLKDYLHAVTSLGKVSWSSLLNRITQTVGEELQPSESSVWASIISHENVLLPVDRENVSEYKTGTAAGHEVSNVETIAAQRNNTMTASHNSQRRTQSIINGSRASLERALRAASDDFADADVFFELMEKSEAGKPVSKRCAAYVTLKYADALKEIAHRNKEIGLKDDVIESHSSIVTEKDRAHAAENRVIMLERHAA